MTTGKKEVPTAQKMTSKKLPSAINKKKGRPTKKKGHLNDAEICAVVVDDVHATILTSYGARCRFLLDDLCCASYNHSPSEGYELAILTHMRGIDIMKISSLDEWRSIATKLSDALSKRKLVVFTLGDPENPRHVMRHPKNTRTVDRALLIDSCTNVGTLLSASFTMRFDCASPGDAFATKKKIDDHAHQIYCM